MYIQNKPASALYKMFIGVLAAVGFWLSIAEFGLSAWRLFSTSVLLAAALYFLISALIIALSKKRNSGQIPCPMLEGALIVSFSLLCVATIIYHLQGISFPGAGGWHASLIYFVLPFLTLSDWLLFAKKGQWHLGYPLYWMAPAVSYAALIILTAPSLPETDPFRYPTEFLDFYNGDLAVMLEWLALIGILMLVYGYILILIDCAASGKISQHIVLPRVKTIVLDEDFATSEPQPEPPIERIEVKLEPMEPTSRPNSKPKNSQSRASTRSKSTSRAKNTDPDRTKNASSTAKSTDGVTRNTDGVKPSNKNGQKSTQKSAGRSNNSPKKKPATKPSSTTRPTNSAKPSNTTNPSGAPSSTEEPLRQDAPNSAGKTSHPIADEQPAAPDDNQPGSTSPSNN